MFDTYDPGKQCPNCQGIGSLLMESGINYIRKRDFERWTCAQNQCQWREIINTSHREFYLEVDKGVKIKDKELRGAHGSVR
jgi:hypothetical protein